MNEQAMRADYKSFRRWLLERSRFARMARLSAAGKWLLDAPLDNVKVKDLFAAAHVVANSQRRRSISILRAYSLPTNKEMREAVYEVELLKDRVKQQEANITSLRAIISELRAALIDKVNA